MLRGNASCHTAIHKPFFSRCPRLTFSDGRARANLLAAAAANLKIFNAFDARFSKAGNI
jgi:hypothetical protein